MIGAIITLGIVFIGGSLIGIVIAVWYYSPSIPFRLPKEFYNDDYQ